MTFCNKGVTIQKNNGGIDNVRLCDESCSEVRSLLLARERAYIVMLLIARIEAK